MAGVNFPLSSAHGGHVAAKKGSPYLPDTRDDAHLVLLVHAGREFDWPTGLSPHTPQNFFRLDSFDLPLICFPDERGVLPRIVSTRRLAAPQYLVAP